MDITSLPAILPTYPTYIRAIMVGTAVFWSVAYVALLFNAPPAPKPQVTLSKFEQVFREDAPGALIFEVMVTNNTGKILAITGAELIYYKDKLDLSGLQSNQPVSATYVIARSEAGLSASSGDGISRTVTQNLPFAGQPVMEVALSLGQTVESGKADRFLIMLKEGDTVPPAANMMRVTLKMDDKSELKTDISLTRK
ncbi:hypothetical protein HFC70_15865 [Agrobacterium sp. a22-2]|uniref:hypothetical protein n=1 Tax=Agrobacterium sp. a22-2 TaxID=2283840 RepID=UPI001447B8CC|nr:hypothetical protein [Agrobacterium sp. a22-2]NKN37829.1 hypothetical protein [Agrobacterium sp. a22-2]